MSEKFIRNEQFNLIKKQITLIKNSRMQNVPKHVLNAVNDSADAKISQQFPHASIEQQQLLNVVGLSSDNDYDQYIQRIAEYLQPFPTVTEQQLKKLFPKHKKLKLPDLSTIDHTKLTYLSWTDLRSNKKFIIYELTGNLVGIECEFQPASKKNVCSVCNSVGEVTYFSTVTKAKAVKNPDYYRAIGNLICVNSEECNKKITSVEYLEAFLKDSLGI